MGAIKKTTKQRKPDGDAVTDGDDSKKSATMRPDEMTPDVLEFLHALDAYKRTNQRPFPHCSEILAVLKSLGYSRPG